MDADRHLLFGLLALQNEFIDKQQLVAAFVAWMANHAKSLDDILVEQRSLQEDERALLARLVDRYIALRGGDVEASLRSISNAGSVREHLEQLSDGKLQASIAKLQPSNLSTIALSTIAVSVGQTTSSGQRFEIRRPLDRGGLGIVSVALDKELNREVALKEIRGDRADDQAYRSKFLMEAEVTGRLEHPGIVPVYGLGTGPDGRPYYAMRLIKGDNLLVHIKQFHEKVAAGNEPYDGAELRKLLRRFLDVCQAIDYAHARGVLHRDLKPGNIMLGKYGETLVVDWGLAKPLGAQRRESLASHSTAEQEPSLIPRGSNDGLTVQGSAVGTAAYAPPEQLSNNLYQVNERSDIYGLGAMLYELLTGHVPAQGETLEAVIKAVLAGNIRPPRSIQPLVPKPLEAICQRAIAKRPSDRFSTAAELGQEIERWLDDIPVHTYPEPLWLRTRRWMRAHQAFVATAVAIILMSVIGLGLYSSIVRRNNDRLAELNTKLDGQNNQLTSANQREREARKNAEEQTELALEAKDRESFERANADRALKKSEWRHYAIQIAGAQHRWDIGDVEAAWNMLEATRVDLRGWEYNYLRTAFLQNQAILEGHTRNITDVSFSPDGQWIGSASVDRTLKIWNATNGQEIHTLKGHTDLVESSSFSQDSKMVLSASRDKTLRVWDVRTGRGIVTLTGHTGAIENAVFSPDAQRVLSVGHDKSLRIWDATSGHQTLLIEGVPSYQNAVFSPDSSRIVFASDEHTLKVLDAFTGKEIHILKKVSGLGVGSPSFSPDGTRILASDHNGTLLWNAVSGEKIEFVDELNNERKVFDAGKLSPDGKRIVTHDPGISESKLWDAKDGKLIGKFKYSGVPFFSPDGRWIVSTDRGQGQNVTKTWTDIYDTQSGESFSRDGIFDVKFSDDGKTAVALQSDPRFSISDTTSFSIWDATNFTLTGVYKGLRVGSTVLINPSSGRVLSWNQKDKTMKLWYTTKGQETLLITGHRHPINQVAFSPNGRYFASASWEREGAMSAYVGAIQIWDAVEGKRLAALHGHSEPVNCISFSHDGKWLVSASSDSTVKTWEAANSLERTTLNESRLRAAKTTFAGHASSVTSASFSPDGKQIVSASVDKTLKIWDAASGEEIYTLRGHSDAVNSVAYSPDGSWIVSASADRTLKVWDARTGREKRFVKRGISNQFIDAGNAHENQTQPVVTSMTGHSGSVNAGVFSPDGSRIVSASDDGTLKLWDADTGQEILSLRGHRGFVNSASFSSDGKRIVSASLDKTLKVWDPDTGQETLTLKHPFGVRDACFSPDSKRIASASSDYSLRIWDASGGRETVTLLGHMDSVYSASFSPDGKRIVSASLDRSLKVWDALTGLELLTLKHGSPTSGLVYSASFSPDGKRIVSANSDKTLKVWDATSGQDLLTFKGHTSYVTSASFSPNGKQIVSASNDHTLKVWDTVSGEEILTLTGHLDRVTSASFSPDGLRIVSASADKSIKVWDTASGQAILTLTGHTDRVTGASFSCDGNWIISSSADKSIKIWHAATGREPQTLNGHTGFVYCASFSPDGQRIVSASADKTLKVWDATTGQEKLSLVGHTNEVRSSTFSPDSQRIVSASADNSIKVWEVPYDK